MFKFSGAARDFWSNVFGNRESEQLEQELETIDEQSLETRRKGKINRPSLYVRVFEGKDANLLRHIYLSLNFGDRYGECCHGERDSFTQ